MSAWWPMFNAGLNAASGTLVLLGYAAIRRRPSGPTAQEGRRHIRRHVTCMVLACAASLAFFVSYLWYHARVGSVHFPGQGGLRALYFTILTSHTILAVVIVPLVVRTVWLGVQRRWDAHRRWARVTLPLWLYVSATGILVYYMLYHMR